jgi:hypothetical protein
MVVEIEGGNRINGFSAPLVLKANAYDPNVEVIYSTLGFINPL